MIPDFEKLNEKMEQASLKEFMPGFDKEEEWTQLSGRLHAKKRGPALFWAAAAAVLLLICAGFVWFMATRDEGANMNSVVMQQDNNTKTPIVDTIVNTKPAIAEAVKEDSAKTAKDKNVAVIKNRVPVNREYNVAKKYETKDLICNGTPCPIQICISQTMRCPNNKPAAISTCATLEPDQSVKLSYQDHDKVAKNCSVTIKEIEIKSIATGETIILNSTSKPSTAQEVFSYITGEKKGDILAGMFSSDCNNQKKENGLRLDNSYGNLIIQQ